MHNINTIIRSSVLLTREIFLNTLLIKQRDILNLPLVTKNFKKMEAKENKKMFAEIPAQEPRGCIHKISITVILSYESLQCANANKNISKLKL